jgi:membrane associated rhomboid family serine protease
MSILEDFRYAFRRPNNGLVQIIIINVVIFLVMVTTHLIMSRSDNGELYAQLLSWVALPTPIMDFIIKPWTIITYAFIHSDRDFFHILFNMLFLYWFGKLVEEYLGNRRLMSLYFLGAVAGGLLYLLLYNTVPYFIDKQPGFLIGASGAVFAVAVGAAVLMPNYTFFLFIFGPVRIKYIVTFYFLYSFFANAWSQNDGGNMAHVGGALFGFLYVSQLKKGNDLASPFQRIGSGFLSWFKRKPKVKMQVTYRQGKPQAVASSATYPSDDEIDRILDKINRSGYESLTKEEKQKLFHASQRNS